MATLKSYDLNGKKLSFANWISEISPMETPFSSMTGKEKIQQTMFQWQTDHLAKPGPNWHAEGATAVSVKLAHTDTKSNLTQIMRKVIEVSDTANAVESYGRQQEIVYQTEQAAKELRRDIEWALLNNEHATDETATEGRVTAGFSNLVAPLSAVDFETGAVVHRMVSEKNKVKETDIFTMTYNLYLAGSDANIIMFHPKYADVFSALQEATGDGVSRQRVFRNSKKFSVYVSSLVDPLGQEFKLIPNRWMPENKIYFFNASDWTQMMLREPTRTKLAKDGSYEKWMIEAELGLRHRNPYASGVLVTDQNAHPDNASVCKLEISVDGTGTTKIELDKADAPSDIAMLPHKTVSFWVTPVANKIQTIHMIKDGKEVAHWTYSDATQKELLVTTSPGVDHAGIYNFVYKKTTDGVNAVVHTTKSVYLHMKA